MLVPAGLLVLMLLAALSVDSAVSYLGQQQLHDALSAAANDSVTAGLNKSDFYQHGRVVLDPSLVGQVVCASIQAQNVSGLNDVRVSMQVGQESIRLVGHAEVTAVFGRSIPGYGHRAVSSSASATVTNGPAIAPTRATGPPVTLQCG